LAILVLQCAIDVYRLYWVRLWVWGYFHRVAYLWFYGFVWCLLTNFSIK